MTFQYKCLHAMLEINITLSEAPSVEQYGDDQMAPPMDYYGLDTVATTLVKQSFLMAQTNIQYLQSLFNIHSRFILIVYPLRPRMTLTVACCLLAGAYTMATLVASPIGIFARYYEVDMRHGPLRIERTYCLEQWPSPNYRHYYGLLTFAIHFVVPLMATSVLYVMIFRRLQGRLGEGATAKSRGHRTTIMLVAVVAVFTIAWTPFHIFTLISEFSYDSIKGRYFKVFLLFFICRRCCIWESI